MEAYVSGTANRAAIINGNQALLFTMGKPEPIVIDTKEAVRLFAHADDSLYFNNSSRQNVLQTLNLESSKSNAIAMIVMVMDRDIEEEDKEEIVHRINELMQNNDVYDYLCQIMFARDLPDDALTSIPNCVSEKSSRLYSFINKLLSVQTELMTLLDELNCFYEDKGISSKDRNLIEGILVNNSYHYSVLSNQFDSKNFQNIKFDIINKLKTSSIIDFVHFGAELCKKIEARVNINNGSKRRVNKNEELDFKKENSLKIKVLPKAGYPYLNVKKQISAIIEKLNSSKLLQAKRLINELKAQQVERGDSEYAALSMCTISEHAKKLSMFELQLEYALEASNLAPQDYRAYGHVADAYLNNEDSVSALKYFKKSSHGDIKDQIYALTGIARIEKQKYNFEVALDTINEVLEKNYEDVVPLLTKAEILKELNSYDAANELYEEIRVKYPESSRAVFGQASLFADRRDFSRSIEIYKHGLANYSDCDSQCYGKSGLGFLLARLGKRSEAKRMLNEACKLSKYEIIFPYISLAKAYRMEGSISKARGILVNLLKRRPHFWEVADELMDLYICDGSLDLARNVYEQLPPKIKNSKYIQLRNAQIYKIQGNYNRALSIIDEVKASYPKFIGCLLERASIFKVLGRYKEARSQYNDVFSISRNNRTARFNIYALNKLESKPSEFGSELEMESLDTVEDFESIAQVGLLQLSMGQHKEGKLKLLEAYNSGFESLRQSVSPNLSMCSIKLGQKNAALAPVKRPKNSIEQIQKAIVLLSLNKRDSFREQFIIVEKSAPSYARGLINIMRGISKAANDDCFVTEELLEEQIKVMLIAA
jgi:tetratricopeptide (TPR) repeat protein